jgi:hypothetical protein
MEETELQQRLTRLAQRTAPPPRERLAEVVVTRHRAQRRQAIGLGSVVAAVAALVVVSTTLIPDGPRVEPIVASGAAAASGVDVLAGPTRGSLAGDPAFVDGVRQLPWTSDDLAVSGAPAAPYNTRRVVFAGDVAGGRWALVVGGDTTPPADDGAQRLAMAWFSGPPGASASQLELDSVPYAVDPQLPVARADSSTGALVVIAAPGDAVEVSARPDIAADGSVARVWQPVDSADGVAVTELPPSAAPYSTAVRYRIVREGKEAARSVPDGRSTAVDTPPVSVSWLRPAPPAAADDGTVQSAVDEVLAQTGLSPADVSVTALWGGEVPGPHDRPARVTLLAVTLPSGAVYLTTPFDWSAADGSELTGLCGSGIQPVGVPLDQQALAMRCDVYDGGQHATGGSSLVVLAPGSSTVRVVDGTGVQLADVPLVDGVAVVPAPERAAAVEASGGAAPVRLRLLSSADLGD